MIGAVTAFLIGTGIYYYAVKNPRNVRGYEKAFANKYRETPTIAVPLNFDEVHKEYLLKLCEKYVKEKKMRDNPAQIETHWLGFRTVVAHPVRMELIRCTNKLAIIQAEEYLCAYLLERTKKSKNFVWNTDEHDENFQGTLFRIRAKFSFGHEIMEKNMMKEKALLEDGESPKNHEPILENDYVTPPNAARHGFVNERAGHEMNHEFSQVLSPNPYAPPYNNERPQVFYPDMENLEIRAPNMYEPQPRRDDSRFRSRTHPYEVGGEQPKQKLPHFETYRRPSNADNSD